MRGAYLHYLAGLLVAVIGLLAVPTFGLAAYGDYVSTITAGGLTQPAKIAINSVTGDMYVTDAANKAVKKYDSAGNYISGFSLSVAGTPVGIGCNGTNIFVGDDTNNCVWIYDMNGSLADLSATGTTHKLGAMAPITIKMPNTVRVSPGGHIFVIDGDNDKIYIFSPDGTYSTSFGVSGSTNSAGTTIRVYYPTGLAFAESSEAAGIVTQYFYIGDQGNYRVQKLYYAYNSVTKMITTVPRYGALKLGTGQGDAFGKFLRVSDVAWDSAFNQTIVVDSLQMVAQVYDAAGATTNQALNYTGGPGTAGQLNVPTGIVINPFSHAAVVVSNQSDALVMYDLANGNPPSIVSLSPATDVTPTATPYSIAYQVDDSDSASVEMQFFYYPSAGNPLTDKVMIGSQVVDTSTGTYSGSYNWDWTTLGVGSYKVYATARDTTNNFVTSSSAGNLLVVNNYDGCSNYTNAMYAFYGASASDFDGDGLSNCDELNGTNHTDAGNTYTSEMSMADTDGDGLTDGEEDNAKVLFGTTCFLNPRNADTDGGGISDNVELQRSGDPCNAADDDSLASSPQTVGAPINIGSPTYIYDSYIEMANTSGTATVIGDLVFRRASDGSVITTIPAINLPPHASTRVKVSNYTTEQNVEADFVSWGAKNIAGTIVCYLLNHYDTTQVDGDYAVNLDYAGAPIMYTGFQNCGIGRYDTWMTVRNPSFTNPVNARVSWFNSTGGLALEKTYLIPAGGAAVINPVNEGLATGQYSANIEGLDGNIAGYFVQFRKDLNDATRCAYALGVEYESTAANKMVVDTFNDDAAGNGYVGWLTVRNPNPTTVSVDVEYYTPAGTLAMPKKTKSILGGRFIVWNPALNDSLPGGQYSAVLTGVSGAAVNGYFMSFRKNKTTNEEWFDQASGFQKNLTGTKFVVPYWQTTYNPDDHVALSWFVFRNNGVANVNITVQLYDMNGNPDVTKVINNIAPNASYSLLVNDLGTGTTLTEGSAVVTATGPITGWIWRLTRNPYDSTSFDSGSGNQMIAVP